jgi:hypothetical protein
MSNKQLLILLTKKDYEDLHLIMNMAVETKEKVIILKMYEGITKQQWYREVIRAGLRSKRIDFEKNTQELG